MKLHEFQAKQLVARYGIPVPPGVVASTPAQASRAYTVLKARCKGGEAFACNVKAQIHAGGRGKAGGVLVATSAAEAGAQAAKLFGQALITQQTGPAGLPVRRVLLDERIAIEREYYLAVTIDRSAARPVILASREGGVEIETVATTRPAAIVREPVDLLVGLLPFQARRLQAALGLSGEPAKRFGAAAAGLFGCFVGSDASLVEINPLVATSDGRLLALDAKVVLDDNALFRQPALAKQRDKTQEPALECRASQIGISYVGLDGTIGCLVNGAGLAMATNDIVTLAGGAPANFLDVGGGANVEQVTKAFRIILSDPRVTAILVNIFGGIMRCDWIAQGLINAAGAMQVRVPIVVRLAGTNVEEGKRLLADSGLALTAADDLAEAAQKVVALANANPTSKIQHRKFS